MTTPDSSEEWIDDIFDAVVSDIQASGYFDKVNEHEPKRAPARGLTASVWLDRLFPVPRIGSLTNTSACLLFKVRVYQNALSNPMDAIDRNVLKAVSNIMRRYHDNFDFDGAIRNTDLLGESGISLSAQAGYIEMDSTLYRVMTIDVPCLVNDVWVQQHS